MSCTIDTSVWVSALLRGEPHNEQAYDFLTSAIQNNEDIILPTTVPIELAMALGRRGESESSAKVLKFLFSIPALHFAEITNQRMVDIIATAAPLMLRGMDAIIVAVAYEFGCRLVTLDQEIARKALPLVEIVNLGG